MRAQLTKENSTKSERRVWEILKKNRIKFCFKKRIGKYEVDFAIGRLCVEIDGKVHKHTDSKKDIYLFNQGYVPIHFSAYSPIAEQKLLYFIRANNK